MKIGLIGADFNSSNKGCEALAYAFMEILNGIALHNKIKIEVVLVKSLPTKEWIKSGFSFNKIAKPFKPKRHYSNLDTEVLFVFHTHNRTFYHSKISEMACVFDFTGGDSFTDIYGEERFYSRTRLKDTIMNHKVPLILGSQTIGPFKNKAVEKYAAEIIKKCDEVYARDQVSYDYSLRISGRAPVLTTDVAFALPYSKPDRIDNTNTKVGLNVSGLLWNGGYTGDNQFGLTCDYQKYCRDLIKWLLSNNYEVHLIPHAFKDDLNYVDNDLIPTLELKKEFPSLIVGPKFNSCIDAKSYISSMDVFTGARMHSTIGAFSAGVPVVPFSYSRKFEGLFGALKYSYVIEATRDNTEKCLENTIDWIGNCTQLQNAMVAGQLIINERLSVFKDGIEKKLIELNRE